LHGSVRLLAVQSLPINLRATDAGSVGLEGVLAESDGTAPTAPLTQRLRTRSESTSRVSEAPREVSLAKRLAYLLQPPLEAMLVRAGPLEWPHDFFPYQREGIAALLSKDVLLLADDMGLGK